MNILPILRLAFDLHREQGHGVNTERDAQDFLARQSNFGEDIKIIVGPTALYASCSRGRTEIIYFPKHEGPEYVRVLGDAAKAILLQSIRLKMA